MMSKRHATWLVALGVTLTVLWSAVAAMGLYGRVGADLMNGIIAVTTALVILGLALVKRAEGPPNP